MALNEATIQHLDSRGLVHDDKTVNRKEVIGRFAEAFRDNVCDVVDDVQDEAKTVAEWRTRVLGDPSDDLATHELNILAGQLLTIGANGPVQNELEDGIVLCKPRIVYTDDNGKQKSKFGRIASTNPDVIERDHDAVKAGELVRKGQSTRASFDLSGRRVPELGRRHLKMLTRTSEEIEQLLLTAPDPDGDSESES